MIPPIQTNVQDNGGVPALREGGSYGPGGGPTSARSGGSARSRVPLSARSATSAISMHVNSYSYLSNRVYDFVQARSTWLRQGQNEGEDDHVDAALKRLPSDFEPFFAEDTRAREVESSSVSTTQDASGRQVIRHLDDFAFRICFAVFSSRNWDRGYLLLALSWSILCPGYMDGAIAVERGQLASLLLVMCAAATTPAVLAAVLKLFFAVRLRSRLVRNHSSRFAGVFFVLATKAVSVPALCGSGRLCECRVHVFEAEQDQDGSDRGSQRDGEGDEEHGLGRGADEPTGGAKDKVEGLQRAPLGGGRGRGGGPTALSERDGEDGHGSRGKMRDRSTDRVAGNPRDKTEVDLPPRHWMCTVCKKVNMLPDEWAGRAGKLVQVVIKRKEVDKQAMYGVFKTKPGVPMCRKCHTPFNYSWRNGSGSDQSAQQRQRQLLDATLSRPTTAASTTTGSVRKPAPPSGASETDAVLESSGVIPVNAIRSILTRVVVFLHRLVSPSRRRRDKNKLIDGGGGGSHEGGPGGLPGDGGKNAPVEPELWYGKEFRRQLATYFKPELERPSLSSSSARGAVRTSGTGAGGHGERQGRYLVGARVACFAGKPVWYPGAVAASRENNTYDVRYDNGDIAQHVFPHMIRFEPIRADSRLLCCYYGLAVAAAAAWPLAGFWYFSSTAAAATTTAGAVAALPAVAVGTAGVLAVAAQFWEIYRENTSTGLWVAAKFGTIFALPSLSLALVGGLVVSKSLNPASAGSWVEMLLLPSMLFSLTGGIYIHAVSPAYGKAWAAASPPWLLFLLLISLRLDGGRGDAREAFGRMRWLGVYFPLWVFLLMLIAAHHVLPYVWDIDVFRMPPPPVGEGENEGRPGGDSKSRASAWLSQSRVGRLATTVRAALAARQERRKREKAAADAAAFAAAGATAATDDAAEGDADDAAANDITTAAAAAEIDADRRASRQVEDGADDALLSQEDALPSQEERLEGQQSGGGG